MKTTQIFAHNAAAALAQVHEQCGPDAVVLSVKTLPAQGVGRLWQKHRGIEVLAGLPHASAPDDREVERRLPKTDGPAGGEPPRRWPSVAWLEAMGLFAEHADHLQARLQALHGDALPVSLEAEWTAVSSALHHFWPRSAPLEPEGPARPHVFIGPPGSGKTTALCKWLTLAVLVEERAVSAWRLDGSSANTSEFMTLYCEMLGVPVQRFWSPPDSSTERLFVDLPGVSANDPPAMAALRQLIDSLPQPRVHLVLNAAYEVRTLLSQYEAFSVLKPDDLIFTHLDEEIGRVKLWNFVFGTNCTIRFLGAGQKIPGEFRQAAPEFLFPSETRP